MQPGLINDHMDYVHRDDLITDLINYISNATNEELEIISNNSLGYTRYIEDDFFIVEDQPLNI